MKLKNKKINLFFASVLSIGSISTLAVACTNIQNNQQENKTQSVLNSNISLQSINSDYFSLNTNREYYLSLNITNVNDKYIQVALVSKRENNQSFLVVSQKTLVTNNKVDFFFLKI